MIITTTAWFYVAYHTQVYYVGYYTHYHTIFLTVTLYKFKTISNIEISSTFNYWTFPGGMVLYRKEFIDEATGAGLFATSNIKASSNIIKTNFMITSLDLNSSKLYCNYCLSQSSSLKRCSKCKHMRYCSEKCQREGWKIHRSECVGLCKVPPASHIPSLIRLCALFLSSPELFDSYSISFLMKHEDIENDKIQEYYPFVLKGVMELLKSSSVDPVQVYALYNKLVVNLFTLEDGQLSAIGSALIPEISKINHSCDPNCVLSFKGRTAYITSIRDIPKGTELTISYIPLPKSFLKRKEQLHTQFNFTCHCSLCSKQRREKVDCMLMRECPDCKNHSQPQIDLDNSDLICPSCGSSLLKSIKMNDLVLKNIANFDSAISTRAQQDVEIINHLVQDTEKLIIEKKWEPALRTGLKATVGLMDWAQLYPSTGLFLAKIAKLYLEQEYSSKNVYIDNVNRAIQMFDISLRCLSLSLPRNHDLFVEVEQLYRFTQETLSNQGQD